MSGFTKGAIEQAEEYINTRIILLFGSEDVRSLVYERAKFDDLLNEKYHDLVTKKKASFS